MNRKLSRRLNRLYKLRYFGRIYRILETWNELEFCYLYQQASRPSNPYWESVVEMLNKSELKEHLNRLLQKSIDDGLSKLE